MVRDGSPDPTAHEFRTQAGRDLGAEPEVEYEDPAAARAPAALPRDAGVGAASAGVEPDPTRYLNRELSWLEFNRRVLHQALDARTPLLERVLFLSIFNSNLDEFFQKRVGGLKRQVDAGVSRRTPDGLTPKEQLATIRDAVTPMLDTQAACFTDELRPALVGHGVCLLSWHELTEEEREWAQDHFERNLFPVLTPLAVDPGHPFPFISNLSTSLGVMLRHDPDAAGGPTWGDGDEALHFARVKAPDTLPGWLRLPTSAPGDAPPSADRPHRYLRLLDLLRHTVHHLFEGMKIEEIEPFRVTRNAAVGRDAEDAADLLELVEQELQQRRFADVVRLEVDDEPYRPLNQFLVGEMGLHPHDVYEMPAELDYTQLLDVYGLDAPALKHEPWTPVTPPRLADGDASIFAAIRAGDLLVHHPYESFARSVERFIREAADDPDVVAIKLTLYRTAEGSPFIPSLIRAAEAGKQVVCLVELQARFDEQRNVQLAQRLEKAGVHVVYGVVGLKTHTKTAVVVRREAEGMRVYAHIGTGNYNSKTANLYTDLGLLTADPRLTTDLTHLFHFLTGRTMKREFEHLLIAPFNMRDRFHALIDREAELARQWVADGGNPDRRGEGVELPEEASGGGSGASSGGWITAKMNSLEDKRLCDKLYAASQAGVRIRLIVRGFCCLRPGVPGLSENIEVVSVVGRFLEHSRVFAFGNGGAPTYAIGSADWMYRNLNHRVECVAPVYDPGHQARLQQLLEVLWADRRQAWDMRPDGTYELRQPPPDDDPRFPAPPTRPADDPAAAAVRRGTHAALMAKYAGEGGRSGS